MKRFLPLWCFILSCLICLPFLYSVVVASKQYNGSMEDYYIELDFQRRMFNAKEWSLVLAGSMLDFVEDTEWIRIEKSAQAKKMLADYSYDLAVKNFLTLIGILVVINVLLFILFRKILLKALFLLLSLNSLVLLILGVAIPMMEITAFLENVSIPVKIDLNNLITYYNETVAGNLNSFFNYMGADSFNLGMINELSKSKLGLDLKFEGRMYVFYQNKSILSLIESQFMQGQIVVAIAVTLFSLVFPFSKLLAGLVALFRGRDLPRFFEVLAKWSMADVFIVALFLGYLAFSNTSVGVYTESKLQLGFYCFFSFVILSLLSGLILKKYLNNKSLDE